MNESKNLLTKLILAEMDKDCDLYTELKNILEMLRSCKSLFDEAPLGLLKTKSDGDFISLLNQASNLSEREFTKWYDNRNIETNASDPIRELLTFLHNVKVNTDVFSNLQLSFLQQAEVLFSTVNVGGREIFTLVSVDVTIVDEASQLLPGDIATLFRPNVKCLVLVGDEKQLPAVVHSRDAINLGYGVSLFDRLLKLRYPYTMLNTQYRMHPVISSWPSAKFYSGILQDGSNVMSQQYTKSWHNLIRPVEFYDIRVGSEDQVGSSLFHEIQAVVVRRILALIRKETSAVSIGIISPYKQQISILSHLSSHSPTFRVKVCTIDGFQGQECDIIILTTVRSNRAGNIGFLSDLRRLNVAITRSRYSIIVVGDRLTLSSNSSWKSYMDYIEAFGIVHGSNSSKIVKNVTKMSTDSDQRFCDISKDDTDPLSNAPWKVIFSKEFQKSIIHSDLQSQKSNIMKKILDLAYGVRFKWEARSAFISEEYADIIHVQKLNRLYLIWSIDIDRKNWVQCLKIWDIVHYQNILKLIRRIENSYDKYSDFYLKCCQHKSPQDKFSKISPCSWAPINDVVWYKQSMNLKEISPAESPNACSREDTSILSKFYDLSTDVARLLLSESCPIDLPFVMSPEEELIVRTHRSMFILGRSGTGTLSSVSSFTIPRKNYCFIASHVFRTGKDSQN